MIFVTVLDCERHRCLSVKVFALRIYLILEMKLLPSILGLAAAQWETNYASGHGGKI